MKQCIQFKGVSDKEQAKQQGGNLQNNIQKLRIEEHELWFEMKH